MCGIVFFRQFKPLPAAETRAYRIRPHAHRNPKRLPDRPGAGLRSSGLSEHRSHGTSVAPRSSAHRFRPIAPAPWAGQGARVQPENPPRSGLHRQRAAGKSACPPPTGQSCAPTPDPLRRPEPGRDQPSRPARRPVPAAGRGVPPAPPVAVRAAPKAVRVRPAAHPRGTAQHTNRVHTHRRRRRVA